MTKRTDIPYEEYARIIPLSNYNPPPNLHKVVSEYQQSDIDQRSVQVSKIYSHGKNELGSTDLIKHEICLSDEVLVSQRYRRLPLNQYEEVNRRVTPPVPVAIPQATQPVHVPGMRDATHPDPVPVPGMRDAACPDPVPVPGIVDARSVPVAKHLDPLDPPPLNAAATPLDPPVPVRGVEEATLQVPVPHARPVSCPK
ncbi:hypothetical protein P4O66_003813 [Electrophorus voltai]|uniref:Uncharacterized protein n=1 Tax=Electrophorus voltai TaxID=2609070 RepID=A0AAD9E4A6_9TELE|nr:hypothetical protein P4O66_003813 [Electrophorus voltai]